MAGCSSCSNKRATKRAARVRIPRELVPKPRESLLISRHSESWRRSRRGVRGQSSHQRHELHFASSTTMLRQGLVFGICPPLTGTLLTGESENHHSTRAGGDAFKRLVFIVIGDK